MGTCPYVRSKLKGPVFVARDLSGFKLTSSRWGCGKVGIPRVLRDFQAGWESRFLDFSTPRLFHSPSRRCFVCCQGYPLGRVMTDSVWSVSEAQSSVQVLMNHCVAAGQRGSPSQRFDLKSEMLKADRIVPIDL